MEQEVKLSVIIVCYQSDAFIYNNISSILKYSDLSKEEVEIIIVDNSSAEYSKKSFEKIRSKFPEEKIVLIHNKKNGGYGQGNNLGISNSKGKHICIMNPDVNLIKPIYKEVLQQFQDNKKVAMIGGKQLGYKDLSFYVKPEFEFFLITAFINSFCNKINLFFRKFMYLSGAFLFIDKEKFEEIGNFDENIFLYCEEPDISNRFHQHGYQFVFNKNIIYHHLIDGREQISANGLEILIGATNYYLKKFNFSTKKFARQKILSFSIMKCIYIFLKKSVKAEQAQMTIDQYKKSLKKES